MKYSRIREINYSRTNFRHEEEYQINLRQWTKNPYSSLKSKLFIEISSIIVFLLQKTKITPNFLTITNTAIVLVASLLFAFFDNDLIKFYCIIIFFFQGALDWADGLLASIKKESSDLGRVLDPWSGFVNYNLFIISLGFFLYNKLNSDIFIYLVIFFLSLKLFDLRNYSYMFIMYEVYKGNIKRKKNGKKQSLIKINNTLLIIKKIIQNILNDRSHWVDTILLITTVEIYSNKFFFTELIYYLIIIINTLIFLGGFYLCFFKNFVSSILNALKNV